ncbi:uncharacterized protein PHALS_00737 [Plasmopara halstedii]|uniref:Uncharacterized protein n=1 Tax=Plasmopara halstedii TaxID=4781 RepID=A0A0P1ATU7_PLAHL|nr:uncharacterized protein PHALS_00737 [Plasmopara halstedii]CEG44369.1 hypothetical protein PHALS_00737 [Plasmopara halstedii]|eukprot:XP_024580738.1 hypothetical protein PHALS_00737 [Plasmopara halstedii]
MEKHVLVNYKKGLFNKIRNKKVYSIGRWDALIDVYKHHPSDQGAIIGLHCQVG